jgi:AraC-like DNA-binding protein/quercetin dioxygenase-like cupin family protein
MSSDGQAATVAVGVPRTSGAGVTIPAGVTIALPADGGFDWHAHAHHQLAWASSGVLVMAVAAARWVLPRSRALWIPAGIKHSVATAGATTMLSLYLDPRRCPIDWDAPTVVEAEGLVGNLGAHLVQGGLTRDERDRAEAVLWDLLRPVPVTALATPMPTDDRARRVAEGLQRDVTDTRSLAQWGQEVGASARTLARLFVAETGVGFERWRTHARLSAALPLLAGEASVSSVAYQVGYATPSAFVAAFRREIGTTPAEYFRPH